MFRSWDTKFPTVFLKILTIWPSKLSSLDTLMTFVQHKFRMNLQFREMCNIRCSWQLWIKCKNKTHTQNREILRKYAFLLYQRQFLRRKILDLKKAFSHLCTLKIASWFCCSYVPFVAKSHPLFFPWIPSESIEWFIDDQAFGSAPPPPPFESASCFSFSVFLCVAGSAYWRERGTGEQGMGEEPIIRSPGSLAICKSFKTRWIPWLFLELGDCRFRLYTNI
jgi:hypothetical protein